MVGVGDQFDGRKQLTSAIKEEQFKMGKSIKGNPRGGTMAEYICTDPECSFKLVAHLSRKKHCKHYTVKSLIAHSDVCVSLPKVTSSILKKLSGFNSAIVEGHDISGWFA